MMEKGELLPYMNGKLVFMNALKYFPEVIREALDEVGLKETDIDLLVPHQANARITQAVQKEMNFPDEKVVSNIDRYGNTTAAKTLHIGTKGTLAASSDPDHLITTIGCEDLIIIHTPDATLVCHKDHAESIKEMHRQVGEQFGSQMI